MIFSVFLNEVRVQPNGSDSTYYVCQLEDETIYTSCQETIVDTDEAIVSLVEFFNQLPEEEKVKLWIALGYEVE